MPRSIPSFATRSLLQFGRRCIHTTQRLNMASRDRQQPHWQPPTPPGPDDQVKLPPLTIWNTLTHTKTPFVPLDWRNNRVTWYACGPTVYDDAHLGHARNYISTDILRRILKDFFKFNVKFVMNITDIDDKVCHCFEVSKMFANTLCSR